MGAEIGLWWVWVEGAGSEAEPVLAVQQHCPAGSRALSSLHPCFAGEGVTFSRVTVVAIQALPKYIKLKGRSPYSPCHSTEILSPSFQKRKNECGSSH